jgi:hypothetical protein
MQLAALIPSVKKPEPKAPELSFDRSESLPTIKSILPSALIVPV